MLTRSLAFISLLTLATQPLWAAAHLPPTPLDSIGIERREGRRYVLHRVDQGQTLYAVARRYRTNVDAIRAANPDLGTAGTVRYDQLLRVPTGAAAAKPASATVAKQNAEAKPIRAEEAQKPTPARTAPANSGTHMVETGQTLYSLAARYGVSMADLRRWNSIGADGIRVGQTLIVSEKASSAKPEPTGAKEPIPVATTPRPKPTDEPVVATTAKPKPAAEVAKLESKPLVTPEPPLAPGTKPKPKEKTTPTPPTEPTAKPAESRSATQKVSEPPAESDPLAGRAAAEREPAPVKAKPSTGGRILSDVGFADVIEGDSPSNKFLALHRTAPVGTLVQVRNDISNQSLYVKVVGKLPDTGLNDQVLIRLSNRAFEKLSPNGQRFRAEVSYTK
jgi:LysM repeat protein